MCCLYQQFKRLGVKFPDPCISISFGRNEIIVKYISEFWKMNKSLHGDNLVAKFIILISTIEVHLASKNINILWIFVQYNSIYDYHNAEHFNLIEFFVN